MLDMPVTNIMLQRVMLNGDMMKITSSMKCVLRSILFFRDWVLNSSLLIMLKEIYIQNIAIHHIFMYHIGRIKTQQLLVLCQPTI